MAEVNKIFGQAKDKYVRSFVVYGDTSTHKLYYESAKTNQIEQADLADAFKKGILMINDGTNLLIPIEYNGTTTVKTLAVVSEAMAFVSWTSKSAS